MLGKPQIHDRKRVKNKQTGYKPGYVHTLL